MERLALEFNRRSHRPVPVYRAELEVARIAVDGNQGVLRRHVHRTAYRRNRARRRSVVWRATPDRGYRIPAAAIRSPAAVPGKPHPTRPIEPIPGAAGIRPPAPGVSGDKRITISRIIAPVSRAEWVPARADACRRPAHTVAGHVIPVAVIIEIAPAGVVRASGQGARHGCF